MQISRQAFGSIPQSPLRQLFGSKNGNFIAPLDLVTMQLDSSNSEVFKPLTLSTLKGATVGTIAIDIGTVDSYELPIVSFDIKPFIVIKPINGISVGITRAIKQVKLSLKKGDSVKLKDSSGDISGTVANDGIVNRSYLNFSNQVSVYRIDFPTNLNTENHGSRVEDASGNLIGMLIQTQNDTVTGICETFVYPAHLI